MKWRWVNMKKVKVIIGANFGDEGKGHMTNYVCSKSENPIVIRFNSGSQAGHTVIEDNSRHVFGHFGSGTFVGAPTFLSKYFAVNPLTFLKEKSELENKNLNSVVYVDEECVITTPYDMLINQIAETSREENRHGSCGLGFNETLVRSRNKKYSLIVKDLISNSLYNKVYKKESSKESSNVNFLKDVLIKIKKEYVKNRLEELNIVDIPEEFKEILNSDILIDNFLKDMDEFVKSITVKKFSEVINEFETLIFEGAQGLMLHQNYKYFPHVTPSNTGIENVIDLLSDEFEHEEQKKQVDIEAIYITRSYLTRHGAGPMPGELKEKPYEKIEDLTNIPNRYQGNLRFALLNLDLLKENIDVDFNKSVNSGFKIKKSLGITCLDQIDDKALYIKEKRKLSSEIDEFINEIMKVIKANKYYLSYGDTKDKISVR